MTSDISEVYDFVYLPDGRRIVAPSKCITCTEIKVDEPFSCIICPFCGHAYYSIGYNTERVHTLQGKCWCYILTRDKIIDKPEGYLELWKKCLLASIGVLEHIGLTCDNCKNQRNCEDGGTNTLAIIETIGCCINWVLY